MNTLTNGLAKRALSVLLVAVMVFSLGLVGLTSVSAANGYNIPSGTVFYFDNSVSKFPSSETISLMVGHATYSRGYKMTNVAGTDLWYGTVSSNWGDATQIAVFSSSFEWGTEESNLSHRKDYATHSTNIYNIAGDYKGTFLLTTDSTGDITPAYQSNGLSDLNHTQIIHGYVAQYGSTDYTAKAKGGTVTVSGKYLKSSNDSIVVADRSDSSNDTTHKATAALARTTDVTITAAPADGYTFMGWSSDGTETGIFSTELTHTYKCVINNKDYYALFKVSEPEAFTTKTIYFESNTHWDKDNPTYYVKTTNDSNGEMKYKLVLVQGETNIYSAQVPISNSGNTSLTFLRYSTDESTLWNSTAVTDSYTVSNENNMYSMGTSTVFDGQAGTWTVYTPAVSIDSVTVSAPETATVGTAATIQLDYSVTGSDAAPTYELLLNGETYDSTKYTCNTTAKTISVDPQVAGTYSFSVKITVNGVSVTTDAVSIKFRDPLAATLAVDHTAQYVGDTFNFTLTDTSAQYDGASYTVYCDGVATDIALVNNSFSVTPAVGSYEYYVSVSVDGTTVNSNTVTITVNDKVFSVTLSAPTSATQKRNFEISSTVKFAPEGATLTYKLEGTDGTLIENNTTGKFTVSSDATGNVTYTVTVTAALSDGTESTAVGSVVVTINEDLGTYPVKIFFKCSDTYGYLPTAKVNGDGVTLTKSTAIITSNATDTATYSWYCYTSQSDVEYSDEFIFAVNAKRNYFYNASYTVSAGEGDFVLEDGYYCYYLAVENLNGGTSTLSNISNLTEAQRNWTESAVNMIYDAETDALAPVALNFSYADYGDANCDGKLNIRDATYIQKTLAKVVEANELSTAVSDYNGDGKVTIKDATAIQKQLANL